MKVTVTFGRTGVVVPCKDGWTVRDLIQQATQRYRKILEQEGDFLIRTHHVEYCDGGILDPDDVLTDLVEDKDKLIAVYEEEEALQRGAVSPGGSSGMGHPSPEPHYDSEMSVFQPIRGGEIEVNSSALKSNTPLLVRSSSDSILTPTVDMGPPQPEDSSGRSTPMGVHHAVTDKGGAEDKLRGQSTARMNQITLSGLTRTVEISGEHGPLGIHVVPYCSSLSGRALGLHIRGVEENSRSRREGIFQDDECIVKINDAELMDKSFAQSQELFRQAMRSPGVRLEVLPASNRERYERTLIGQLFNQEAYNGGPKVKVPLSLKAKQDVRARTAELAPRLGEAQPVQGPEDSSPGAPGPVSLSPKGKAGGPPPKMTPGAPQLAALGNKKGKRLKIDLRKGPEGLGFTVVTRDSSVHGPGPILVKNILPRGAAIKDGRLQSGDRILEVNGTDVTGRTQEELVAMLRSTRQGECVSLVVSRPEELFLPRELKGEQAGTPLLEEGKEQLMFEVPLNDSGSAGLGVSLKGNKSRDTGEDLGIFIKSIIHGGAAFKDGRLRVNDQLIAVNGESLLGKSNHDAMETLRRSMSMEGNLRGMIQLVVLRFLDRPGLENHGTAAVPNRASDTAAGPSSAISQSFDVALPPMVTNNLYEKSGALHPALDRSREPVVQEEWEEEKEFPPLPPRLGETVTSGPQHTYLHQGPEWESDRYSGEPPHPVGQQQRPEDHHVKSSKSMDLVADESNVGSLSGQKSEAWHGRELGPTLGLKKSSSLESLQTAMSEVGKKELPFHRPRAHMVRGRGCNESFRNAIDKSYDGPAELDDDDLTDQSSGQDTPASGSSRQGLGDVEDTKKEKKKEAKGKKKDKAKSKAKEKDKDKAKKKTEDTDEQDRKAKRKGFGLLRFGKKKEAKAVLPKQKSEVLSEEELGRMKDERERIEAKHQELRDRQQPRDALPMLDVEDDDTDPNYARINHFRDPPPGAQPPYRERTPSPPPASHSREPSADEQIDGLYAKVNKQRPPALGDSNTDRIQMLRREYQQARWDGVAPAYQDLETRRRGPDLDPLRMPARGHNGRQAPNYEDVERQYASLPRRGPADPPSWGGHREPAHYPGPGPQPGYPGYPSRDIYTRGPERRAPDPRQGDPGHYPPPAPQQRGPLRQDVPPSPTLPLRGPRYNTMNRGGYQSASPERYAYGEGHPSDPRQKNPMTAAV